MPLPDLLQHQLPHLNAGNVFLRQKGRRLCILPQQRQQQVLCANISMAQLLRGVDRPAQQSVAFFCKTGECILHSHVLPPVLHNGTGSKGR